MARKSEIRGLARQALSTLERAAKEENSAVGNRLVDDGLRFLREAAGVSSVGARSALREAMPALRTEPRERAKAGEILGRLGIDEDLL